MERTAIPPWVARRGWSRRNPVWVRVWLDRRPKVDRADARRADRPMPTATILPFAKTFDRT